MVIELSEVQFGLKSYAWFQNRTSAQREFDLISQVWFQTRIGVYVKPGTHPESAGTCRSHPEPTRNLSEPSGTYPGPLGTYPKSPGTYPEPPGY